MVDIIMKFPETLDENNRGLLLTSGTDFSEHRRVVSSIS